jgi:octaheme c-type cytochrome (tetrathionate reductase family)
MRNIFLALVILGAFYFIFYNSFFDKKVKEDKLLELKEKYDQKHKPLVDHSKLAALNKDFKTPQDVTLTCLSCHNDIHKGVMNNNHWKWEREDFIKGRGVVYYGKKNGINNFCIGIGGSEQTCTKCHVGYGWKDYTFDFNDSSNIDCLACHAAAGTYRKGKAMAGYPAPDVDLGKAARSVGLPTRTNCGTCHFFSGGGNNVKHGDLEKSLFNATRDVDVHLGTDGINMECVDCHTATDHKMKGRLYALSSTNENRLFCEDCHTSTPHDQEILNEHTVKVACQTCHIPVYAKVNKTKVWWDWSKAGKLKDGKPYTIEDDEGYHTYKSIKGQFVWKKNLKPDYVWFNGTADHYIPCDKVDTNKPIMINTLHGSYNDKNSKIIPVKIHRAKQIYDAKNKRLIQPKLFSKTKEEGGFWKLFDWDVAARLGMLYNKKTFGINKPDDSCYSGDFTFVRTDMYWPINHMVSPADQAVKCIECHTSEGGRLAKLTGFYMPARDRNPIIETVGLLMIIFSFIGVFVHGAIRIVMTKKYKNKVKN